MNAPRSLLVALPAFALGCLLTAAVTARAQIATLRGQVDYDHAKGVRILPLPTYRIADDEAELNKYAAQGYEVKSTASTANYIHYLMVRAR